MQELIQATEGLPNTLPSNFPKTYLQFDPNSQYWKANGETMASRRVGLYKYTSIDGRWRYLKAVFYPNNRIKAHAVLDKGIERVAKGGQYVFVLCPQMGTGGQRPRRCGQSDAPQTG
jgi:hypothetical protein